MDVDPTIGDSWSFKGSNVFIFKTSTSYIGIVFSETLLWESVTREEFQQAETRLLRRETSGVQAVLLDQPVDGPIHRLPSGFLMDEVQPEGVTQQGGWRCFRTYEPPPFSMAGSLQDKRYGPPVYPGRLVAGTPVSVKVAAAVASVQKGSPQAQAKPPTLDGYFVAAILGNESNSSKGSKETRRYALVSLRDKAYLVPYSGIESRRRREVEETVTSESVTTFCHSLFTGRSPVAVHSAFAAIASANGESATKYVSM